MCLAAFVHHTAIHNSGGFKSLAENEEVEYNLIRGPKGHLAVHVTGPHGQPVQGDSTANALAQQRRLTREANREIAVAVAAQQQQQQQHQQQAQHQQYLPYYYSPAPAYYYPSTAPTTAVGAAAAAAAGAPAVPSSGTSKKQPSPPASPSATTHAVAQEYYHMDPYYVVYTPDPSSPPMAATGSLGLSTDALAEQLGAFSFTSSFHGNAPESSGSGSDGGLITIADSSNSNSSTSTSTAYNNKQSRRSKRSHSNAAQQQYQHHQFPMHHQLQPIATGPATYLFAGGSPQMLMYASSPASPNINSTAAVVAPNVTPIDIKQRNSPSPPFGYYHHHLPHHHHHQPTTRGHRSISTPPPPHAPYYAVPYYHPSHLPMMYAPAAIQQE